MTESSTAAILETAVDLWKDRDQLSHDIVDGSFYWRHCRGELIETLEEIVNDVSQESDTTPLSAEQYAKFTNHLNKIQSENPSIGSWIANNPSPRMRDSMVSWLGTSPSTVPIFREGGRKEAGIGYWCLLGVRDSHWTGEDVERAYRESESYMRQSEPNRNWLNRAQGIQARTLAFVGIDFTFYGAGELTFRSDWGNIEQPGDRPSVRIQSPFIMCAIPYPFPPNGLIATIYDAIARQQHGWNRDLFGYEGGDQKIATSIRTWAIGLLLGNGMPWREAERKVASALALDLVLENSQWTAERQTLLARVPEARPYIYSPRRAPKTKQRGPS